MANLQEPRTARSVITVGTASAEISRQQTNSRRILFSLINTSTGGQSISIAFGQEAIAGQGIVLAPGGFYTESEDPGFKPTNEQITAIASGAGATLAMTMRVQTLG